MKEKALGFFQEITHNGTVKNSNVRLNSFISLWAGIAFAFYTVATDQVTPNTVAMFAAFMVGAFAPKVWSKYAESKFTKTSDV